MSPSQQTFTCCHFTEDFQPRLLLSVDSAGDDWGGAGTKTSRRGSVVSQPAGIPTR